MRSRRIPALLLVPQPSQGVLPESPEVQGNPSGTQLWNPTLQKTKGASRPVDNRKPVPEQRPLRACLNPRNSARLFSAQQMPRLLILPILRRLQLRIQPHAPHPSHDFLRDDEPNI